MRIEINAALPTRAISGRTLGAIKAKLFDLMLERAHGFKVRGQVISYKPPAGPAIDANILVMDVTMRTAIDADVTALCMALCTLLEQPHVTVRIPSLFIGAVVGPEGDGIEYDNDTFIGYVVAETPQEVKNLH